MSSDTQVDSAQTDKELRQRLRQAEGTLDALMQQLRSLEQERGMFSAIVEAGDAGFLLVDRERRVHWTNGIFFDRFNRLEANELRGASCHQALCAKSKPCDDCPALRSIDSGGPAHAELRLWRQDGVRQIYVTGLPLRATGEEPQQSLLMVQDVTDLEVLRKSEEAFLSSETRFRTLYEQMPAGMATIKIDGAVLQANPAFCTMLGYTAAELRRMNIAELTHPQDLEESEAQIQELISGRSRVVEMEKRYLRRDGETVWARAASVLQHDEEGRPAYTLTLIQDVTQRKQAQRSLEQSKRRYETLVNSIDGIVWEAEADAPRFAFISRQVESLLGHPLQRWLTQPRFWRNHLHTDDLDHVVRAYAEGTAQRRPFEVEYRLIAADGRSVWVHDRVTVAEGRDGTVRLCGIMTDITEKREAQRALEQSAEQLRQSQKMEAIGRLAGGIAHDFNNLITTIAGYSDILLRGLGPDHPMAADVREVAKAGTRAGELTAQLLAFSRQQVLRSELMDLNAAVADMDQMLRRTIGEDIELASSLASDLGAVSADPGQIQQVILNLAVNARDAMPDGGMLKLETANVDVVADNALQHPGVTPGRYVLLVVTDTGCGMDEQTRAHLFEPFFTTKEPGKGTGLGLSTVYGIVAQSGGHVRVESQAGVGTRFAVYLPRQEGPAARAPQPAVAPPELPLGTETILLVEDDESVRDLARRILEMSGYRVVEADNGLQALSVLEALEERVDLIATDLVMPQLGGVELARRVEQIQPGTKVLYLSGYADSELRANGRLDREAHFLQKPFSPAALSEKVREVLDA